MNNAPTDTSFTVVQLQEPKRNPWAQTLAQSLRLLAAARAEIVALKAALQARKGTG